MLVTPVRHSGAPAICPLVRTPRSLGDPKAEAEPATKEGGQEEERGSGGEARPGVDAAATADDDAAGVDVDTDADIGTEAGEDIDTEAGADSDAGGDVGARADSDPPSFVYQRRKFVLKRASGEPRHQDDVDKEEDEEEEGGGDTFGLVELPTGWPLGR